MTQGIQSWCSVTTWRDGVGREMGWGSGGRGHMYVYDRFMFMYSRGHHDIVIIFQLK